MNGEGRDLLEHVRGAAGRACDDLVVAADELVEMLLALHARVLVDRHEASVLSSSVERAASTRARGPDRPPGAAAAGSTWTTCSRRRVIQRVWRWLPIVQPQTPMSSDTGSTTRSHRGRGQAPPAVRHGLAGVRERRSARPAISPSAPSTAASRSAGRGSTALPGAPARTSRPSSCSSTHAFDTLGCRRVEFKTDAANERSRGALEALGREVRRHPREAHAGARRREQRLRLVRDPRRRLAAGAHAPARAARAGRAHRAAAAARAMIAVPGIPRELEQRRCSSAFTSSVPAASARPFLPGSAERGVAVGEEAAAARAALRPGPGDRGGRRRGRRRPVGRARERSDPARRARPAPRRFGLHPLQTFMRGAGAEQLDGAWAAVTAETGEAQRPGAWLARCSDCGPSISRTRSGPPITPAPRSRRTTSSRCAAPQARCSRQQERLPRRSIPLMRRTIENGFELDGPDRARRLGDGRRGTSRRSAPSAPELEALYRALADGDRGDRMKVSQDDRPDDRRPAREPRPAARSDRPRADDGRAPRRPPALLLRAARDECDTVVMSLFVNPTQFGDAADLDALPAGRGARPRLAADGGRRPRLRPNRRGDVSAGLPDLGRRDRARRDARGRRTGRATSAASRPSA